MGMSNLDADAWAQYRKASEIMQLTRGRFWTAWSKSGCMSLVALANGKKRDMDGNISVLSVPMGISGMSCGNGRTTTEASVSAKNWRMKAAFNGVEMIETVTLRRRRRWARWRSGMVWPLDIKGKRRKWGEWEAMEMVFGDLADFHSVWTYLLKNITEMDTW